MIDFRSPHDTDLAPLPAKALDVLMPMHIRVSATGHIVSVGPTIAKIRDKDTLIGARFLEVFELRRPVKIASFADLLERGDAILRAKFREGYPLSLKGVFVPLSKETEYSADRRSNEARPDMPKAAAKHAGALVNLSLGANIVDAVQRYKLSGADFAASDPTVDMLYLIEAKSIALDESKRLNSRLETARNTAEEQAFTDTLTVLQNRRGMDAVLAQLERSRMRFGLMHLDLDYFKQVNDTYGHAAGDHVLREVAEILHDETRKDDLVARVGGDEFVLVFKGCVDLTILKRIAQRIIMRLEEPIAFGGSLCRISASIGTTLSTFYTDPAADQMLSDADHALYESKEHGRACHTIFRPEQVHVN